MKRTFNGEVPHFPGKDSPRQCADVRDCPPDFPGCKKAAEGENPESSLKDEGQDCEEDSECKSGTCGKDKTCAGGEPKSSSKRKRFSIGIAAAYDFINIPSRHSVCTLGTATVPARRCRRRTVIIAPRTVWTFRREAARVQEGIQNINVVRGDSDRVSGGFAPGNFAIMASFDYAATSNIMLGLRLQATWSTRQRAGRHERGEGLHPADRRGARHVRFRCERAG